MTRVVVLIISPKLDGRILLGQKRSFWLSLIGRSRCAAWSPPECRVFRPTHAAIKSFIRQQTGLEVMIDKTICQVGLTRYVKATPVGKVFVPEPGKSYQQLEYLQFEKLKTHVKKFEKRYPPAIRQLLRPLSAY